VHPPATGTPASAVPPAPTFVTPSATAATNDDEQLRTRLAAIPGLDLEQAGNAVLGKLPRLASLLVRLGEAHAGDARRIRELVEAGETEQAREIAHMLKGTAANFGLTALSASAATVEAALRAGDTPDIAPLTELLAATSTSLASLASITGTTTL
jgi:HPt (histidine-containing phosphotransfer) domain-containing protein